MKPENLNKAVELKALIDTTKEAKAQIQNLKQKPVSADKKEIKSGCYSLNVSEHSDGSGILVKLSRYWGNDRIINVIEAEIDKQIVELEAMLTEL